MRMQLFSIRDAKVETWHPPMAFRTIGEAERQFGDLVNAPASESVVAAHPEDYTMYMVGEFDAATGLVSGCQAQEIARAVNLRRER